MAFLQQVIRCSSKVALRRSTMRLAHSLQGTSVGNNGTLFQPAVTPQQILRTFSLGMQLKQEVNVTFVRANGEKIKTKGKVGDSLLDVVVNNNLDLDGYGACEGTLTCSTCHLIFKPADYEKLPDKPGDEELDMLDLAYELTDTSRLGCQIILTKDMDGLVVNVPATINDARSA